MMLSIVRTTILPCIVPLRLGLGKSSWESDVNPSIGQTLQTIVKATGLEEEKH